MTTTIDPTITSPSAGGNAVSLTNPNVTGAASFGRSPGRPIFSS